MLPLNFNLSLKTLAALDQIRMFIIIVYASFTLFYCNHAFVLIYKVLGQTFAFKPLVLKTSF